MDPQTGHVVTGRDAGDSVLLAALRRASRAITLAYEPDRVLQAIVDHAPLLAAGSTCLLVEVVAPETYRLLLAGGPVGPGVPPAGAPLPSQALPAQLFAEEGAQRALPHDADTWLPDWVPAPGAITALPFVVHDAPYAALLIYSPTPLEPRILLALELLLAHAATSLENSRLLADTYEREGFYNALARVSLATSTSLDRNTVLDLICQESITTFGVNGVYVWQRRGDALHGIAARGDGRDSFIGQSVPLDGPHFSARITRSGQARFLNDFGVDGDIRIHLPHESTVRAVLGIPLRHEDDVIGTLMLVDTTGELRFNPRHISYAMQFGGQAAIAILNAQLVGELRALNEQLDERVARRTSALAAERDRVQFLLRVASELAASLDEDRVLTRALEMVSEVIEAAEGVVLLPDQEGSQLRIRALIGRAGRLPPGGVASSMHQDEGLAGWILRERQSVVVDDVQQDPRWRPAATPATEQRSAIGVPLLSGEETIGVIMFFRRQPAAFSREHLALVEAVAYQVANAIGNAQLYFFIQEQAEQIGGLLRQAQQEAAKREAILESLADGLLVADEDGNVIVANTAVTQILGVSRQQLLGRQLGQMTGLFGPSVSRWLAQIDGWARRAGQTVPQPYYADELQLAGRIVNVRLSPVYDKREYLGTVSIFRDITREREADRAKSDFVSNVSHELRTPMTSIKGYTDLLLMGAAGKMSAGQRRYLQVIQNNADRLKLLVDDILNISRIETGKMQLIREPVDLRALVTDVVDGHLHGRIHSEGRSIAVSIEVPPDLPPVPADPEKLTRVLTNLVDNAFNYTEAGGRITIRARLTGRSVTIDVVDTGIGIAPDVIDKIFDRFYRAAEAKERMVPGTGLGLAIVSSLVHMHGGTLDVASTVGEGSIFTFTLPLDSPDESPPQSAA